DSTPCEDGNVCTSETGTAQTPDHCEAGVCTGGPVDCSGEDDQCNVGVCNAGSGACEADPVADSTPCEDGDNCTSETGTAQTPDHCETGVCTGIPVDCSAEDDQCNTGVCDVATGACEDDPLPDSTPCQDGFYCTSETGDQGAPDHCETGNCTGVPVDCPEPSQCRSGAMCDETSDSCDDGTFDGTLCKDPCSGDGKQKPPKELEFLYINTAGDAAFDEACIIVTHHLGQVWTFPNTNSGDYFSFSRDKKLQPKIEIEICSDATCTDTSTCEDPIMIHTSCSVPLNIGDLFGPNDELELTGEIFESGPAPAPVTTSREGR
ncbi:MAG: hypothetical protein OEV00_12360, partial [Acidobacteriota bacterium]|nr:hypothetical protein [Acidobacteriota bacterium]